MRDYLTLGPTPCSEACQQVGPTFDPVLARKEMMCYIAQLRRQFPSVEECGVYFKIKSFPHDLGSYSEVCVIFDDDDEQQMQQAYRVENELPEFWDIQATAHMSTLNTE